MLPRYQARTHRPVDSRLAGTRRRHERGRAHRRHGLQGSRRQAALLRRLDPDRKGAPEAPAQLPADPRKWGDGGLLSGCGWCGGHGPRGCGYGGSCAIETTTASSERANLPLRAHTSSGAQPALSDYPVIRMPSLHARSSPPHSTITGTTTLGGGKPSPSDVSFRRLRAATCRSATANSTLNPKGAGP